jgi:negative regulator of sigma E activity
MTVTQEQFGSVKEDIRTLSDMVLKIDQAVTDHSYQLSMIRVRQVGMDMRFDKVQGRLDKVEARLDGIDGRLDGLQGSVNEILTLVRKSQ